MEEGFASSLDVDISLIVNIIIGIGLVFFGITQDTQTKYFKLKNTLILYISLGLVIVFLSSPMNILILLIIGFFAGGFIFLNDEKDGLEKELNKFDLLIFSSLSWLFLNKTYIWLCSGIFIIILMNYFSIQDIYLLSILLGFLVYHYLAVAVDIFGYNPFDDVRNKLDISVKKRPNFISELLREYDNELLAFLLFMEDRRMFRRKGNSIEIKTDVLKSRKYQANLKRIFKDIKFEDPRTGKEKIKSKLRGYSTIGQQLIRNMSMSDNTYRYTVRRKIYIERIYLYYFEKAVCKRKARSLISKNKKRKEYRKILSRNLKYRFLINYYITILKEPENKEELIEAMAKESRVSKQLYTRIYTRFNNSVIQKYHRLQVEEAKNSDPRF